MLNSAISTCTTCFVGKVCGKVCLTWVDPLGEGKSGVKAGIVNTSAPLPPCNSHLPGGGGGDSHLAQTAYKILGAKGAQDNFYKAPNAPKLIYPVILWDSLVVQSPPALRTGGNRHFVTSSLPWGGTVTTLVGR